MSQKYPGGFITKSPVAPTSSAASGMWTLDQAMQLKKQGLWPTFEIGSPFGGGFFAGQITQSGSTYNLVVGPVASAQNASKAYKNVNTNTPQYDLYFFESARYTALKQVQRYYMEQLD